MTDKENPGFVHGTMVAGFFLFAFCTYLVVIKPLIIGNIADKKEQRLVQEIKDLKTELSKPCPKCGEKK